MSRASIGVWVVVLAVGCGTTRPSGPTVERSTIAKERVEAMKRLAAAAAKDPNGPEVRGIVEEMRNQPLDPAAFPTEASEVIKIYNEQVKSKLTGELGQEVAQMIAFLERALRQSGKAG